MTVEAGTKLGRYEIRSKIGEGGMGEVYLAEDIKLNRKVVCINPKERILHFENGATAAYDGLVSSIPLPELIPSIAGAPRITPSG